VLTHRTRRLSAPDRRRAEETARRRALFERVPDGLEDLDAAAECWCSCHPRPGQLDHEGERCLCQLAQSERRTRSSDALARLVALAPSGVGDAQAVRRDAVAHAAHELGLDAREAVPGVPWVIVGTIDGRGFYLRERHEEYEVIIAPDDDPGTDPWASPPEQLTLVITSGDVRDLIDQRGRYSPERALRVAAAAVRTYQCQRACTHL